MSNEKVYGMRFGKIYSLLVAKAQKKGRTLEEVNQVVSWLTGYTAGEIEKAAESPLTYGDFFRNAPRLNPNRKLITGVVCGGFDIWISSLTSLPKARTWRKYCARRRKPVKQTKNLI